MTLRSIPIRLLGIVILSVIALHAAFWFGIAAVLKTRLNIKLVQDQLWDWGLDARFDPVTITGYPFAWRINFDHLQLDLGKITIVPANPDTPATLSIEAAWPLNITASWPTTVVIGSADDERAKGITVTAPEISVTGLTGRWAWRAILTDLRADDATTTAIGHLTMGGHGHRAWLIGEDMTWSSASATATPIIVDHALAILEVKGSLTGLGEKALRQWADGGGTIEIPLLAVAAQGARVTGNGTLALDPDLQPLAAFSLTLDNAEKLLSTIFLDQSGLGKGKKKWLKGLLTLAEPLAGPTHLQLPLTIQDGHVYLGDRVIGIVPSVEW